MFEDLTKSNAPAEPLCDVHHWFQQGCLGLEDRYLDWPLVTRSKKASAGDTECFQAKVMFFSGCKGF